MSEYQYVAFRAIDRPVSDKNMAYMHKQSSRAEITPWSFDNEYHYGDFRGDAMGMLQRGYDLHFHFSNFGTRTLMLRLPQGLPNPEAVERFLSEDGFDFFKDNDGPGGILHLNPCYESDELSEPYEIKELVNELSSLRMEILDGDLRPFYLAHLAVMCDSNHDPDEDREAPVPIGLEKLTKAQKVFAELYDFPDSLITAAAQGTSTSKIKSTIKPSGATDFSDLHAEWLKSQSTEMKDVWLAAWMSDAHSVIRADILAKFRNDQKLPDWPTIPLNRTITDLFTAADEIERDRKQKKAESVAREKAKRLAAMAANPAKTLEETEKLAKERTMDAYNKIADLLTELREALEGGTESTLAENQAKRLRSENPTLTKLSGALNRAGFPK